MKIQNYAYGKWIDGDGEGTALFNSVTGEQIGSATSRGLDFGAMMDYARNQVNPKLRKMTFQERGLMLKALALHLLKHKKKYYEVSFKTGATKIDSWIDIEGGIGNLFANASLRKQFPDKPFYVDGDMIPSSKNGTFIGHHIMVPLEGVAVHINAYNFPVWGMLEKVAVNLMAGMPAIVKPATVTSYLTEVVVKDIVDSGILPEGSVQLISGSARGILDYVTSQDVVTFTGSASTGQMLKAHPNVSKESVRFNMEADSLNCSILGKDAIPGTPEYDIFIKEVAKEMSVKAGQKCTAIRRTFIPENLMDDVKKSLSERLKKTVIGNPLNENTRMGALAGLEQRREVMESVKQLLESCKIVYADDNFDVLDADKSKGAFMSHLLLESDGINEAPHNIEAFGPVNTLMPYKSTEEVIELAKKGKGSLVGSVVTSDDDFAADVVIGSASHHGRFIILNKDCAKESTGHGSPLPNLVHGGPGRAGGGEEMGGKRGVFHYMQRTAIQGSPQTITKITGQFQVGAKQPEANPHVFRQHFEELKVGDTVFTHKRTITEGDIVNFANVSWDHFYAHTDVTSLDETIFEERVAHGYFILSAAAGLFVDAKKGPVLLNYGIDECRFTKPVYAGATIGVKFTVKEKIDQEKRSEEDIAKGIVKFLVDVYDETGETVAIATILTMVKKIDQN